MSKILRCIEFQTASIPLYQDIRIYNELVFVWFYEMLKNKMEFH